MFQKDGAPRYVDNFPEPVIDSEDQVMITVQAAAIKHLDKSRASGSHYSIKGDLNTAKVIGGDGVGYLEDGTKVYALGVTGMMAEKAVISKSRMIMLPDGINPAIAAALPNAVAGSAMALRFRAEMKTGDTVLINGATGFTGRIAVQVARHYGAKKIIVTGRNDRSLQYLLDLGADEVISLRQEDESFIALLKKIHEATPIDIVVDYLWGHTAELILESFKGQGNFTHRVRFVSVGSMAGDKIQLSAEILRSADLDLTGSGIGSWTKEQMKILITEIIPEMLQLAADGKLNVEVQTISIEAMETIWDMNAADGKRLVVLV
jgi:NADPH:quinone reductase-like Zn-dependent oxidoreductase